MSFVLLGLLTQGAAYAQNKVQLSDVLETVRWNTVERGPLLAVDPESVFLMPGVDLASLGPRASSLSAVAPLFSRRLLRVGGLTVLAPETMAVLNTRPEPQAVPVMKRDAAFDQLILTFSETQWKKAGSSEGIGAADMETDEQRLLFSFLSASPLPVMQYSPARKELLRQTLALKQLAGLRFRIQRTVSLTLSSTDAQGVVYRGPSVPPAAAPTFPLLLDPQATTQLDQEANGYWTVRTEKSRPKPGNLDFTAAVLASPVSLAGITNVREAVKRCATATHLELYADGRMARLPLFVRADAGTTVRAGDLLKGLCALLTGTFRKVSSGKEAAMVLTDDLAGYGTRMAYINRARTQTAPTRLPLLLSAAEAAAVPGPTAWRLLSVKPDPEFTPTEVVREALDAPINNLNIPVSDLPAGLRQRIAHVTEKNSRLTLNQDQVRVDIRPQLEYLVPGLAPITNLVDARMSLYFTPPPPTEVLPEPGPVPALLTGKKSAGLNLLAKTLSVEAARALVRLAAEKRIRQVWLEADVEIVRAGVVEGQKMRIAVGGVVSLLRATPEDTRSRDVDIFGEASDWLLPEAPETLAKLQGLLRGYAAIPGLAGLLLTDTAPPGCGIPEGDLLAEDGSEAGYTPERRLAYLRSTGFDPIDLVRGKEEQPLPYLQDRLGWDEVMASRDIEMFRANRGWSAVRYNVNLTLMRRLYADLRAAHPTLPLLVRNRGANHWYGSWDKPDGLPYSRQSPPTPVRPQAHLNVFQEGRLQSRHVLQGMYYRPGQYQPGKDTRYAPLPDGPAAFARAINHALEDKSDWDGLVLDLRSISVSMLPELLSGVQL